MTGTLSIKWRVSRYPESYDSIKAMKKLILLTIFISASTSAYAATYDAWVQSYANGPWTKYGSYADYGKCEAAIKYLWHPGKKCLAS
jgi:hypothetical protein